MQLPSVVVNDVEVVSDDLPNDSSLMVHIVVHRETPWIGIFLLFAAAVSSSSTGAVMEYQGDVSVFLKLFWRRTLTTFSFTLLASTCLYRKGIPTCTRHIVAQVIVSGIASAAYSSFFLLSMRYTSVGEAYLFCNSHTVLLVLRRIIFRLPVTFWEIAGALLAVVGGVLCSLDKLSTNSEIKTSSHTMGNLIACTGAVGAAVFLTASKAVRKDLDLFVFMASSSFVTATSLLIFILSFEEYSFSTDASIGLFGWIVPRMDRLGVELYFACICDTFGTMGFVAVLKYFEPIVVSVVMLLQPFIATLEGLVLPMSTPLPGVLTICGGLIVLSGTIAVLLQTKRMEFQVVTKNNQEYRFKYGSIE